LLDPQESPGFIHGEYVNITILAVAKADRALSFLKRKELILRLRNISRKL